MNTLCRGRETLAVIVAVALLAGCGSAQNTINAPTGSISQNAAHKATSSSGNLIYTDDEHGKAAILTFDGHIAERFQMPSEYGAILCSDSSGNVWAADTNGTYIYGYTHGGTSPVTTLYYQYLGIPRECSVDPNTGDLAVCSADINEIAIFQDAQGSATYISTPFESSVPACTYDSKGNLYAYGSIDANPYSYNAVAVLARGSTQFTTITFRNRNNQGNYFLWNNNHLYLTQGKGRISEVKIMGSTGKLVQLPKDAHRWGDASIIDSTIVAPYLPLKARRHLYEGVGFWPFSKAGAPMNVVSLNREDYLVGLTVSVAPSQSRIHK